MITESGQQRFDISATCEACRALLVLFRVSRRIWNYLRPVFFAVSIAWILALKMSADSTETFVTGATGFVGSALSQVFKDHGEIRAALWSDEEAPVLPSFDLPVVAGSISRETESEQALDRIDVVVHLTARVRVMREKTEESIYSRLWESLQIDSAKAREQRDWRPSFSFAEGVEAKVEQYRR